MLNRLAWNFLTVASISVLAGVAYFFYRELGAVEARREAVVALKKLETEEGPCAALLGGTEAMASHANDYEYTRNVDVLRQSFAAHIVAGEDGHGDDEGDRRAAQALVGAADQGLLSPTLCEQIKLAADLNETHPVMALLRFTREKDPCEEALALDQVISGLGSQRALLLRGLMEDIDKLSCLTPTMTQEVAVQVANMLHDDPQAFDDLNVLRIARFLTTWAPMQAAQVGCRIDAFGDISRLGSTLGCTPDHRARVLARYRYGRPLPSAKGEDPVPAGQEVVLIWQTGNRCEVRPAEGEARILTVACSDLEMVSGLDIAVLIEQVAYGVVRADMISGLAEYSPRTKVTKASTAEPALKSWFAYNRTGQAVGITQVTSLEKLAEQAREEIPESPLRAFCQKAGAKYCYDVDWTQVVARLDSDAAVYLSRPLDVFLREAAITDDKKERLYAEAFGGPPPGDSIVRVYDLTPNGESRLVFDVRPGGVTLRWRIGASGTWHQQSFGEGEGGKVPPAARLMAAMDIQQDGRPELILQRAEREQAAAGVQDITDEIVLVQLDEPGGKFVPLTQLTVHEY